MEGAQSVTEKPASITALHVPPLFQRNGVFRDFTPFRLMMANQISTRVPAPAFTNWSNRASTSPRGVPMKIDTQSLPGDGADLMPQGRKTGSATGQDKNCHLECDDTCMYRILGRNQLNSTHVYSQKVAG